VGRSSWTDCEVKSGRFSLSEPCLSPYGTLPNSDGWLPCVFEASPLRTTRLGAQPGDGSLWSSKICVDSVARYRMSPNCTSSWRQVWVLGSGRRGGQSTGPSLLWIPSKMQMRLLFEHLVGMSTAWVSQVQLKSHGMRLDIREGLWM